MKPRHAAALALVGWYLMAPPIRPGSGVDLSAPISRWALNGEFDSAGACDEARVQRIERARTRAARIQGKLDSIDKEVESKSTPAQQAADLNKVNELNKQLEKPELDKLANYVASMRAAQCIATDDPRLKGN